jgi:GntR family transcriptional regulator
VTSEFVVPRYHAIELALRERIHALAPHAPLPSEATLCAEFGVSRMTARSAVTQLVNDGLVYRQSGRGTFVAPPPANRRADSLVRFSEQVRRQGRTPSSLVLAAGTRAATAEEVTGLRPGRAGTVVEIRRVRIADTTPVAVETAVFPGSLAALLDRDLAAGSLHAALVALGRVPTRGHATIAAAPAGANDSPLLGVAAGTALLVVPPHPRPARAPAGAHRDPLRQRPVRPRRRLRRGAGAHHRPDPPGTPGRIGDRCLNQGAFPCPRLPSPRLPSPRLPSPRPPSPSPSSPG